MDEPRRVLKVWPTAWIGIASSKLYAQTAVTAHISYRHSTVLVQSELQLSQLCDIYRNCPYISSR